MNVAMQSPLETLLTAQFRKAFASELKRKTGSGAARKGRRRTRSISARSCSTNPPKSCATISSACPRRPGHAACRDADPEPGVANR